MSTIPQIRDSEHSHLVVYHPKVFYLSGLQLFLRQSIEYHAYTDFSAQRQRALFTLRHH